MPERAEIIACYYRPIEIGDEEFEADFLKTGKKVLAFRIFIFQMLL